ncbi:hypothetical protein GCM10022197_03250 [Microlunatus spumicola]|uniref:DUF1772 domain-containing protein n=1 Tax=Microlunatus spumicola TaxID=81499 RepID=A0ABP6WNE4_9ACTN
MPFWSVVLVATTAAHAAFQLTVSAVVYPALVRVGPDRFAAAHDEHSRRIVRLVALVYGAALTGAVGAVVTAPTSPAAWLAALATGAAMLVTAVRAAPLHGRLGRSGPEADLLLALVRADRLRTVAALAAAVAALVHALAA